MTPAAVFWNELATELSEDVAFFTSPAKDDTEVRVVEIDFVAVSTALATLVTEPAILDNEPPTFFNELDASLNAPVTPPIALLS